MSQIIIYQSPDGQTQLDVQMGKDEKVAEAVIEMNTDGVPTSTMAKYLKISKGKNECCKIVIFHFL